MGKDQQSKALPDTRASQRSVSEILETVCNAANDSIFVKDRGGRYLYVNPTCATLFGAPAEAIVGTLDEPWFGAAAAATLREDDRRVMDEGVAINHDEDLTIGGGPRSFSTTKVPYRDAGGRVVGIVGIARDVTERRRVEAQLQDERERFTSVATTVPGAIYSFRARADGSMSFPYASPAIVDIYGLTVEEVLAEPARVFERIHPDDRNQVSAAAHVRPDGTASVHRTFRVLHPTKGEIWVESHSTSTRDAAGDLVWHGILFDVTHRKQLEEQLRQSHRMEAFGQLAGGVAHDFNNLLTVILSECAAVGATMGPGAPGAASLAELQRAAERAAGLTRQLLAFSRKTVLEPKVLDINVIVRDTEKLLLRLVGEDVQLTTHLAAPLRRAHVDPSQLVQVLMNLTVNARDAMPDGGDLHITTANVDVDGERSKALGIRPGPYLRLSVADTGSGMTPEVRARVFQPFFTTKPVGKGTGLGLAVVHGIVLQSGGAIELETAPGQGARFHIFLPAATSQSQPRIVAAMPEGARATAKLLLVEDDDAVRRLARRVLATKGYAMLVASDGVEALEVLEREQGRVDLVVTDVVMPNMDGRELAERIRERFPGVRILFVSGYTDDVLVRRGLQSEEVDFLPKPYTPASLLSTVERLLGGGAGERATEAGEG